MAAFYTMHEWSNTDKGLVVFTAPGTFDLEPAALRPGSALTIKNQIIPAPTQSATATATSGGALAAGTYYYKVSALIGGAEGVASNEESQATTGSASTVTVTWSAVTGATGYKVYRGTAAGSEDVYYTVGAVTTYTDTGAAAATGSPLTGSGVTVTAAGSDLIDGNATVTMNTRYDWLRLFSDGTNWNIAARTPSADAS